MSNQVDEIYLNLNDAIDLALSSINLRKKKIPYNLYYVVGTPGGGKTAMFKEKSERKNCAFLPYSPALERQEKFGGIPDVYWTEDNSKKTLRTIWSVPQMIGEINDLAEKFESVVVLLDDWHLCNEDLQQIGFELFTYYSLNSCKVKNNVIFVLAGNTTSAAGAKIQLSAIRNRSTIIHTKSDPRYWISNYALTNNIHPLGVSFFQNEDNYELFQEEESTVSQFGSPRSWTSLFNIISELEQDATFKTSSGDLNRELLYAVVQGSVSKIACKRFMMHYDIYSKINFNEIFEKEIINIPTNPAERYAYVAGINYEFYRIYNNSIDKYKRVYCNVIKELKQNFPELASILVTSFGDMLNKNDSSKLSGAKILIELYNNKFLDYSTIQDITTINKLLHS